MMKKLLLSMCVLFAVNLQLKAQFTVDTLIKDTVHYYFNKYYFKTAKALKDFPAYKAAAATVTQVTHVGSIFENPYESTDTLMVTGLEAFAARHAMAIAPLKVHLYLCELDANGKPILPALDSVMTSLTGTNVLAIGGNLHNKPRLMTKNFAVLFRNMSNRSGDTAFLIRTSGMTHTSVASPEHKHSDGLGVVRYLNNFYSATNYTALGFGHGTDYEFCVAPRVSYWLHSAHATSLQPDDSIICTQERMLLRNFSSKRISHRMWNLVEFKRRWDQNPNFHLNATPAVPFPSEASGITWHLLPEDHVNYHLPVGADNVEFYTDSAFKSMLDPEVDSVVCFPGNEFRVRHHTMAIYGRSARYYYTSYFNICTEFCGRDNVGILENGSLSAVHAHPNPSNGNHITIGGMTGDCEILLYDITGKLVSRNKTNKNTVWINLSGQPSGVYVVRVTNSNSSRVLRIVKE